MKALVVYGTRWGGTVGVAQKISDTLRAAGHSVSVFEARDKMPNIANYDLVIVGSGIRADLWTKAALEFLGKNAEVLNRKKTALFVSCQMADSNEDAQRRAKSRYLFDVADKYGLKPIAFGFFGGFVDFKKSHGPFVDIMVRVNMKKLLANGLDIRKVYDTRNWDCIEAWTREVAKMPSETQQATRSPVVSSRS